jgi:sugar lactone lactonase YvrE
LSDTPELFASGLSWPESPRWRDGALYVSDVHNFRLVKLDGNGIIATVCEVPGRPAGMDFAGDGSLLLATGLGRQLLRIDPASGTQEVVAELGGMAKAALNDLITHASGWSWFGDTGFRFGVDAPAASGSLWAYHPSHGLRKVVEDVFFPNGAVLSEDQRTLYLAETFGKAISAFDVSPDGELSNRRIHARLPGEGDGLCLDADDHLWVPMLFSGEFLRIAPNGSVVESVPFPGRSAIACVLGGADRKTLFMCVCAMDRSDPENPVRHGEIYTLARPVSGAGRP